MKPLRYTGASSNMAYYAEPPRNRKDRVFCEVIRQDLQRLKGTNRLVRMERPKFSIRVYREGAGRIAERRYRPRNQVPEGPLDAATVTRLVRLALKAEQ